MVVPLKKASRYHRPGGLSRTQRDASKAVKSRKLWGRRRRLAAPPRPWSRGDANRYYLDTSQPLVTISFVASVIPWRTPVRATYWLAMFLLFKARRVLALGLRVNCPSLSLLPIVFLALLSASCSSEKPQKVAQFRIQVVNGDIKGCLYKGPYEYKQQGNSTKETFPEVMGSEARAEPGCILSGLRIEGGGDKVTVLYGKEENAVGRLTLVVESTLKVRIGIWFRSDAAGETLEKEIFLEPGNNRFYVDMPASAGGQEDPKNN